MNKKDKLNIVAAFTLIEIIIVISIIGSLFAVGTIAHGSYLQSTRDAKRKLDLEEIRVSLEKYRTDNSTYPDNYTDLFSEGYMAETLKDPLESQSYKYTYDAANDMYKLSAKLENTSQGKYYIVTPKGSVYRDEL